MPLCLKTLALLKPSRNGSTRKRKPSRYFPIPGANVRAHHGRLKSRRCKARRDARRRCGQSDPSPDSSARTVTFKWPSGSDERDLTPRRSKGKRRERTSGELRTRAISSHPNLVTPFVLRALEQVRRQPTPAQSLKMMEDGSERRHPLELAARERDIRRNALRARFSSLTRLIRASSGSDCWALSRER